MEPVKHNEINNPYHKETLASAALSALTEGQDYTSLDNTRVIFAYLDVIKDHGYEAVFKVITDKQTIYFQAQKDSVVRINDKAIDFVAEFFDEA